MNKFLNFSFIIVLFSFLAGCDVYTDGFDTSSVNANECLQSGGICEEEGAAPSYALALDIRGPSTIRPMTVTPNCNLDNDKYCFDISGSCNVNKQPISVISVKNVIDTTNGSEVGFSVRNGPVKCERGKFWIQLALDKVPCRVQRATIEMIAKDTTGAIYTNPTRAVQEIDMLAEFDDNCGS